jgi:hypothetical protein
MKTYLEFLNEDLTPVTSWDTFNSNQSQQSNEPKAQSWKETGKWITGKINPQDIFNNIKDFCSTNKIIINAPVDGNQLVKLFNDRKGNLGGNIGVITLNPDQNQYNMIHLICRDPKIVNDLKILLDKTYTTMGQFNNVQGPANEQVNKELTRKSLEESEKSKPDLAKLGFYYNVYLSSKTAPAPPAAPAPAPAAPAPAAPTV